MQFVVVFLFHSTDNQRRILVNIFDGKGVLESQPFFLGGIFFFEL